MVKIYYWLRVYVTAFRSARFGPMKITEFGRSNEFTLVKEVSQTLSWILHFDDGFLEADLQRLVFLPFFSRKCNITVL